MPGSTTIESVASLAAESGVRGSGVAAALIRTLQSLQGQPATYQVRMFIEPCELDRYSWRTGGRRYSWRTGGRRRVTVEVRDVRTGQSIGVKVLQPCRLDEAAEMVAGYTARQVLRKDPSTPDWAVGSADGEDLSAYLLARQTLPEGKNLPCLVGLPPGTAAQAGASGPSQHRRHGGGWLRTRGHLRP